MPSATALQTPLPLTEDGLRRLVDAFYASVRADPMLGPIFEPQVDDWTRHSERIVDFWSSIVLGSGRYKGNPFGAHLPFQDRLSPAHFERWLELWSATARRMFDPRVAELLEEKAGRIAASLQAGLLFSPIAQATRADAPAPVT